MSSWYETNDLLVPSIAPYVSTSSYRKENFRQAFEVSGNEFFNEDDIAVLQVLYESYTSKYAPLSAEEAKSNIQTTCTIYHQSYSDGYIDYEMVWESSYHNVSDYHELFQNWTLFHNDNILEDWNLLLPQSDIIQLAPPTVVSRITPTETYTNVNSSDYPMWASSIDDPTIVPVTTGTTTENSSSSPNTGVIVVVSIMIVMVVVIVGTGLVSVCSFYRNRSVATSTVVHRDPKPSFATSHTGRPSASVEV